MIFTESVRSATSLAHQGDFHSAIEALADRWQGVGREPLRNLDGDLEYARLLLVCGILTVEIGRFRSAPCQAAAKDLLSKATRLFADAPERSEAEFWLGVAYIRCGENSEALAVADTILAGRSADSLVVFGAGRLKGLAYLNLGRLGQAEDAFSSVEVFLDVVPALSRGKFYLSRGMLFRQSGRLSEALSDYRFAISAFRECGSVRFQAAAENNTAGVYTDLGELTLAHTAAESALSLFTKLGDRAHEAKTWDQIARIYEQQGNYVEMVRCSDRAVEILSAGDHDGWLAEALITQGTARARAGIAQAEEALGRALSICEIQGDPKQGDAVTKAMWEIVQRGKESRNSMGASVSPLERAVYERVLEKHQGHVSPAAHELGLHHHVFLKRLRHFPELLVKRRPPRTRRFFRKTAV